MDGSVRTYVVHKRKESEIRARRNARSDRSKCPPYASPIDMKRRAARGHHLLRPRPMQQVKKLATVNENTGVIGYSVLRFSCPPDGKLTWAGGVYSKEGAIKRNLYTIRRMAGQNPLPDRISFHTGAQAKPWFRKCPKFHSTVHYTSTFHRAFQLWFEIHTGPQARGR